MTGFECTISVPDIQATAAAVEANGGAIVMQICTLAGIGRLLFFQDPEGNLAGAMQYDTKPSEDEDRIVGVLAALLGGLTALAWSNVSWSRSAGHAKSLRTFQKR